MRHGLRAGRRRNAAIVGATPVAMFTLLMLCLAPASAQSGAIPLPDEADLADRSGPANERYRPVDEMRPPKYLQYVATSVEHDPAPVAEDTDEDQYVSPPDEEEQYTAPEQTPPQDGPTTCQYAYEHVVENYGCVQYANQPADASCEEGQDTWGNDTLACEWTSNEGCVSGSQYVQYQGSYYLTEGGGYCGVHGSTEDAADTSVEFSNAVNEERESQHSRADEEAMAAEEGPSRDPSTAMRGSIRSPVTDAGEGSEGEARDRHPGASIVVLPVTGGPLLLLALLIGAPLSAVGLVLRRLIR